MDQFGTVKGVRRVTAPTSHEVFVGIHPGLESVLGDELASLGINGTVVEGGVTCTLDGVQLGVVLRRARTAGQVLVRVGHFRARDGEGLVGGVRGLPWERFVAPRQPVEVTVSSAGSRLRFRDGIEGKVLAGIQQRLHGPRRDGPRPPRTPVEVRVRIVEDRVTMSVDAGGERLHRRGWRTEPGGAPLRENLAAALLFGSGWRPGIPLVDAMCGSGTFSIEAATWGGDRDRRPTAAESWPVPVTLPKGARQASAPIWTSDRDPEAAARTQRNILRSGAQGIRPVVADFREIPRPNGPPGLWIANPPYGVRMGTDLDRLLGAIGADLSARWSGWRATILVPGPPTTGRWGRVGLKGKVLVSFSHGGRPVTAIAWLADDRAVG